MNERFVHYLTGIERIDQQHAGLFELFFKIRDSSDIKEISALMSELLNDIKVHFAYEESVMIDAGYPYREYHFESHAVLMKKLESTLPTLTTAFSRKYLISVLEDAIYAHIDGLDIQMAEWIKEKCKE